MRNTSKIVTCHNILWAMLALAVTLPDVPEAQNMPANQNRPEIFMSEAQVLLKEADDLFNSHQYVPSRVIYQKALSKARLASNNSDITEALSMIARTFLVENDIETGYEWLLQAEPLADDHEPLGWSRYQLVKGRFLWREKHFDDATRHFKELYDYCSDRKLYDRAVDAAHMVAITGTPEEQVEWAKKGIKEAETGKVNRWLGPLWNNLGATYEEMGKYDSSLSAYRKARKYHYQFGNERNKIIADYAVGHALVKLKKYEEAGEWLQPVLRKCEETKDDEFIGLTCRDLSDVGAASGNYKEAYALMLRAHKLLKAAEMDQWDPDGFRQMEERLAELEAKL